MPLTTALLLSGLLLPGFTGCEDEPDPSRMRESVQKRITRGDLSDCRTEDHSRKYWEDRLRVLNKGDSREATERVLDRLLPRYARRDRSSGLDGKCHVWYRLDDDWTLLAEYGPEWPECRTLDSVELLGLDDLRSQIDPKLYQYVALIHRSPGYRGLDFSPPPLIRAVNGLHGAGKPTALRALRAYRDLCVNNHDLQLRYGLDTERIYVIAQVLFQRFDGTGAMRMPYIGGPAVPTALWEQRAKWPVFPLVLVNNVPFSLAAQGFALTSGQPEDPLGYLAECEAHCRLRRNPLRPQASPTAAVGALLKDSRTEAANLNHEAAFGRILRLQALRAISWPDRLQSTSSVATFIVQTEGFLFESDAATQWEQVQKLLDGFDIRWSQELQKFCASKVGSGAN